jgi:hypothetical protein
LPISFGVNPLLLLLVAVYGVTRFAAWLFPGLGFIQLRICSGGLLILRSGFALLTRLPLRACCAGFVKDASIVHD